MEYLIAGIRISLPDEFAASPFARALVPFAAIAEGNADLTVETGKRIVPADDYRELDKFDFADVDADCRFGRDAEGYLLTMSPRDGSAPARFRTAYAARAAASDITPEHNPALFRFGVWTMFNIAAVEHEAVAIHSSVICRDGEAVLFLGESGTGKSTHTRLWRKHIPDAELLNDDSPIVRIIPAGGLSGTGCAARSEDAANTRKENAAGNNLAIPAGAQVSAGGGANAESAAPALRPQVIACGSPWSGKTPCYRNLSYPIRAIVRLSQAPHNSIRRLRPVEAIGALLPSCPPSFAYDERLHDAVCRIVSGIVAEVPVYHLECLPDAAAARLSFETVFGR